MVKPEDGVKNGALHRSIGISKMNALDIILRKNWPHKSEIDALKYNFNVIEVTQILI